MALNVLIVDDSPIARAIILKALRICGVSLGDIHQAENGREGLAILHEHAVDLALVDINMPVMSGEEMLEKLRSEGSAPGPTVIIVSSDHSVTRRQKLLRLGAHIVHKPFTPECLRDVLEALPLGREVMSL